jgi:tetratricopeptide (TPR) repeat protein
MSIPALILLFLQVVPTQSADPEALFQQANQWYSNEQYAEAVQAYEQITASGSENGILYFNLGNAYYKLEQNSRAILNYERARRFRPNDPDLLANLQLAQMRIVDKITPIPDMLHVRIWNALVETGDERTWRTLFILGLNITAVLLCIRILFGRWHRGLRAGFLFSGLVAVIMLACAFSASNARHTSSRAVVMADKVEVRGSPAGDGIELFALHEGTVVKVLRRSGDWLEIVLADGNVGWAPGDTLEMI